jgi:hypothetical protein
MSDGITVSTTGKASAKKDSLERLDYVFDWSDYLDELGDMIDSFRIITPLGIDVVASQINGYQVAAFVEGGTTDETYRVACEITTMSTPPRVAVRSVYLKIVDR